MRYSQLFGRTSKTTGTQLPIKSHRLLVQAGYVRESTAGRYYFLPLGWRVHRKLTDIIRREMDAAGAQELVAPILHPLELWQETNRQTAAGFELTQLADRRGAKFALGGTAEEMMVDLVRNFNISYRDLPFNIYQFGLKFRDELRSRGGLLRTREFVMKDAYSFSTEEQFEAVYQLMAQTYQKIFDQLGLTTKMVAADGGYIGGEYCHEFIVPTAVGESKFFETNQGYLAHEDIAVCDKGQASSAELAPLKEVSVDRGPTMNDSQQAHAPAPLEQHLKNVAFVNERQEIVLACLRGDLEVNEVKLQKAVRCLQLTPLTAEQITTDLQSAPGFISPVGLKEVGRKLLIVADDSLQQATNLISGANKAGADYLNINLNRDFKADLVTDIALAKAGQTATDGQELHASVGIEVGNIFQLGYHYSDKMKGAEYTDEQGKQRKYYMGCYGIGLGRTIAAVAEVKSDDKGLIWPVCLAPYHVHLVALVEEDDAIIALKTTLEAAGLEVLYDDRTQVSNGEKLADADLIGLPLRLVVSRQTRATDQVEIKLRSQAEPTLVPTNQLVDYVQQLLKSID